MSKTLLDEDYNQVFSIAALPNFNFPRLRTLLLCTFRLMEDDNNIKDLSPLLDINLPSLQMLQIYGNKANALETEKLGDKLANKFPGLIFKLSV